MKKILSVLILLTIILSSCRNLYVNHKSSNKNNWWIGEYYMLRGTSGVNDKDKKLIVDKNGFHISTYGEDTINSENFTITSTSNSKIVSKKNYFIRLEDGKSYQTDVTITITPHLYKQSEEMWIIPEMTPTSTVSWENKLIRIK